jgi:hypothetical protein
MSSAPIPGRCAHNRPDGTFCERWPLNGKKRCKRHGGAAPVGVQNGRWVTGRYSKYLPPRLQERYQFALSDPTMLSVRDDIALLDARLEDLLRRADTGEAGKIWQRLKQQKAEMLQARSRKDPEGVQAALQSIMVLIDHGFGDHLTWEDIRSTVLDRNRLVRSESRRLVDAHQMVTVERLVTFMQVLGQILLSEIPDKTVARRIVGQIQSLMVIDGEVVN